MKHLIYAFLLVISSPAFSQSRHSIQIPDEPRFTVPEKEKHEKEVKSVQEEKKAQAQEEKQRLQDDLGKDRAVR